MSRCHKKYTQIFDKIAGSLRRIEMTLVKKSRCPPLKRLSVYARIFTTNLETPRAILDFRRTCDPAKYVMSTQ